MPAPFAPPTDMIRRAEARLLARMTDLGDSERSPTDGAVDEPTLHTPSLLAGGVPRPEAGERYVFGEVFAAGGLGVVRRAEDRRLGRVIAVKELLRASPEAQRRFALEAAITARLQHPGVVPLYDLGWRDGGEPYYCMKLVDGESLEAKIRGAGGLARRLALLEHVIAVADTIAYAHSQQIIHRDLKPANVLVGRFGEVVVIDWGLAKDLSGAISQDMSDETSGPVAAGLRSDMTEAGTVMGTLRYMAPEQARGEPVDVRSDIYSLGAILYHVLSGEPPFRGEDSALLATRVMEGAVRDLRRLDPQIPRELAAVAHRAMAHDPADRYASADEFASDLRRFLAGRLVGAHAYSLAEVTRRWIRRHRVVVGAAAVSLAALSGAMIHAAGKERAAAAERARAELAELEAATLAEKASRAAFEREALARAQRLDTSILRALELSARTGHDDAALQSARAAVREAQQTGGPVMAATRALTAAMTAPRVTLEVGEAGDREGFVRDVLFSGDVLVTHSGERTLRAWDATTGRLLASAPKLWSVELLPDGDILTVTSDDGLAIRDPHTLEARRTIPAARGATIGVSADGRLAAVILEVPGTHPTRYDIHVWDLHDEREITVVRTQVYSNHASFSADNTRMFTDYWQGQLWSLPDGKRLAALSEPAYSNTGRLSPDGRRALTTNLQDFSLEIWDVEGKPRRLLHDTAPMHNTMEVQFLPDGERALALGWYDAMFLYDTEDGRLLRRFELGGGTFYKAALSPDGRLVAAGGQEGTVQIFEVDSGLLRARLPGEHGGVMSLRFAPDGRRLVVGTTAGIVDVWDVPQGVPARWTVAGEPKAAAIARGERLVFADAAPPALIDLRDGRELARLQSDGPRERLALSTDGALVLTTSADGRSEIWDAATGALRCAIAWPTTRESWMTYGFTADDAAVVLVDPDFAINLWSTADCDSLATVRDDLFRVGVSVVGSPPERFILRADDVLSLLDPRQLDRRVELAGWQYRVNRAELSHDGARLLLTGQANDTKTAMNPLRLVDAATGQVLRENPDNVVRPIGVEFAPDDETFLMMAFGRALLYGADDLRPLHPFDGLPSAPALGVFSPDGERVAVVDEKGAVGLWDTRSGTFGGVLTHLRGRPLTLAFSDDGADLIAVGGTVGAVRVPATTDGLLAASER